MIKSNDVFKNFATRSAVINWKKDIEKKGTLTKSNLMFFFKNAVNDGTIKKYIEEEKEGTPFSTPIHKAIMPYNPILEVKKTINSYR